MPDEENVSDDFSPEDSVRGKRGNLFGMIPSFVIVILKWVFIVLFIITIMIVISFWVSKSIVNDGNFSNDSAYMRSPDTAVKPPVLSWYDQLGEIRSRTADADSAMIIVRASIGYTKEDEETLAELIDRKIRLQDAVRYYFSQKKKVELQHEALLKGELKNYMNQMMNTERIQDIAFISFDVIDM